MYQIKLLQFKKSLRKGIVKAKVSFCDYVIQEMEDGWFQIIIDFGDKKYNLIRTTNLESAQRYYQADFETKVKKNLVKVSTD